MRQPKENEILLLSSLESPDSCQHDPSHPQVAYEYRPEHLTSFYSLQSACLNCVCVCVCVSQSQKTADVCLVHCSCGRRPTQTNSVIIAINKFLIGLQSGQERQRHGRLACQRAAEDDTNRSVSSIEEDFLTASEQLGEDSEDDPFRNGKQCIHLPEIQSL